MVRGKITVGKMVRGRIPALAAVAPSNLWRAWLNHTRFLDKY